MAGRVEVTVCERASGWLGTTVIHCPWRLRPVDLEIAVCCPRSQCPICHRPALLSSDPGPSENQLAMTYCDYVLTNDWATDTWVRPTREGAPHIIRWKSLIIGCCIADQPDLSRAEPGAPSAFTLTKTDGATQTTLETNQHRTDADTKQWTSLWEVTCPMAGWRLRADLPPSSVPSAFATLPATLPEQVEVGSIMSGQACPDYPQSNSPMTLSWHVTHTWGKCGVNHRNFKTEISNLWNNLPYYFCRSSRSLI